MKAIVFNQSLPIDQPNALFEITLDKPTATGRDLLIKISAIGVNPVDSKVRLRALPDKVGKGAEKVLGFDAVGTVEAIGEQVSLFNVGDMVFYAGDVGRQGSNAEFQLCDERIVGFAPKNASHAQAAALPLTSITAYEILFDRLMIDQQNKYSTAAPVLLITGAAGGVGSIMIQLAKALCPQATVIATASREASQAWCEQMGADHVINHHDGIQNALEKLGIKEVSHIASLTHTNQHFDDYIEIIKPQGKICLIDDPATPLNFQALKMKSVSLHWELMFTRARFETEDMIKQHHILNEVAQLVDAGKIQSTLTENLGTMNADNLIKAHEKMERGDMIGKLVLEVK